MTTRGGGVLQLYATLAEENKIPVKAETKDDKKEEKVIYRPSILPKFSHTLIFPSRTFHPRPTALDHSPWLTHRTRVCVSLGGAGSEA